MTPTATPTSVLVVEDDRLIAKGIEKQLKSMGYAVAGTAATGEEAVRRAVELRPDVVLMDISLGAGIDGVEAAGLIRQQLDVPVVYLTANSDAATLQRAKLTDPFGYVLKPYEDKDLRTAIEIGEYRHRMERRLRENEQWLAATLGSIGDGVIATDERGRVRFLNALAGRLTGWAQADATGADVREVFRIVGEASRRPVANPALESLERAEPTTLAPDTVLIDRAGAERPIDGSAAPIRDASGTASGAVLVFRDTTERRRLEEHLRQAQRMEAVGRLAGGIAHDFNNIMTIITGYSELLLADDRTAPDRHDMVRSIHDAGRRAAALTQQIMAFGRKQMLVPSVLSLNAVVRDMGEMVRRLVGPDIAFATDPAPDLGRVRADPTQIGQVVLNLAANARDAMPNGGRLVVATANAELDEEFARRHPDVKPGRYAMLSVADTGCGMSEDVRAQVFEPFFTTKGVGQGTGLGLATVYGIVKQSGGHIEASSRPGEGTTFRVYLPVVAEPEPHPAGAAAGPAAPGRETILIVEDEEAVRRMTKMFLSKNGYTVLEAANGTEALAVAGGHRGPIHLLLTDLVMPNLSGREVAERLAAVRTGLRVLFMSGYTEDVAAQQGAESAADFLPKPFSRASLTTKVREVLDRC
ncbi:response regulator [Gemmata sp.]|uniref:hybrid sensor histidine kinase/response regulator n=1 Tax=Gemmata sp. TaxID=1914242 RepID=UPI003F70BD9D